MPGGNRHTGFTRILHRTKPDPLMGEIETFRADPLQPKCDDWWVRCRRGAAASCAGGGLAAWLHSGRLQALLPRLTATAKLPARLLLHFHAPAVLGVCLMGAEQRCSAHPASPACPPTAACRCEYPVSDRGNAVRQFFNAAAKNPSMIKVPGWAG